MSTLHRTQILLEREQHQALTQMARRSGCSVSELVRQTLRERLAQKAREEKDAEVREALEWFRGLRERIRAKHGVLNVDLVEEVRQEADSQLERIWRGEG
jgi:hypothetical protein